MYKGFKIVCVTPAGRARYMKILLPYILSSPYVDEYHIWVNTTNQADLKFLRVCEERFSKVKLIHLKGQIPEGTETICKFFKTAIDDNTIYIRFDDDIVFIEEGFFESFLDFRINNPHYFLVFPMIINNAVCTYVQKTLGKINLSHLNIAENFMDPIAWASPTFAAAWHKLFLDLLEKGEFDLFKFGKRELPPKRFSINCISWWGSEFKKFGGIVGVNEEEWLSVTKTREVGKTNCMYGEKIVSHFAFYTQREYLDQKTSLLEHYRRLCESRFPGFWHGIPI